ncbi:MAG: glycosyltransferase family 8 protein [Bacteroidales bacterium]|nr:glycosyltransferase family 8 protein [Bacteroidales bacterium]
MQLCITQIQNRRMIDIAINIDSDFVTYAHVMLYSLEESNLEESFTIHVINIGLNDAHKKEFVSKHSKMEFRFYSVDDGVVTNLPMWRKDYVSSATYLRIFMPDLLPQSVNKVLFLDCDTLILDSIRELWDTDLETEGLMIAAVEERPPYDTKKPALLNYNAELSYFNAGVALINLKAMRNCDFSNKASLFIEENRNILQHHDQDIMNALAAGRTKFISCRWNLLDFFTFKNPEIQSRRNEDLREALCKPAIVHFSNKRKPWRYNCDNPFRNLYLDKASQYGVIVESTWELEKKYRLRKILYSILLKKSKYLKPEQVTYLSDLFA